MRALQSLQKFYLEKIEAGDVTPFPEWKEKLPEIKAGATQLADTYAKFLELPADSPLREGAAHALREALQPLGGYLQSAETIPYDPELEPAEAALLAKLRKAERGASSEEEGDQIEVVGSAQVYALIHLPVPLSVRAVPGATVYFETAGGGRFQNGLPIIPVEADANGLATARFTSIGDATGDVPILISSPEATNEEEMTVVVVQPLPLIPSALSVPQATPATPDEP